MTRIDLVYVAIEVNRREQKWALQRERVLKIKAADPDLSVRDIASRVGVSKDAVVAWLRGETRSGKKTG